LLVTERETLIKGNTALNPQRTEEEIIIKKPVKEEKDNKEELLKRKLEKELRLKERATVLLTILFTFIMGFSVVFGYSRVYQLQQSYNESYNALLEMKKNNENLRIQLVKFNDEQLVRDKAVNTLNMIKPNEKSYIKVDFSKSYFEPDLDKANEEGKSFISSLLD